VFLCLSLRLKLAAKRAWNGMSSQKINEKADGMLQNTVIKLTLLEKAWCNTL